MIFRILKKCGRLLGTIFFLWVAVVMVLYAAHECKELFIRVTSPLCNLPGGIYVVPFCAKNTVARPPDSETVSTSTDAGATLADLLQRLSTGTAASWDIKKTQVESKELWLSIKDGFGEDAIIRLLTEKVARFIQEAGKVSNFLLKVEADISQGLER